MASLKIRLLGSFLVSRDDEPIGPGDWPTQKTQDLLKILLTERGHVVPKERLMELLWPDLKPGSAANSLRVGISHLRRILEPDLDRPADSTFILTRPHGYMFQTTRDPSTGPPRQARDVASTSSGEASGRRCWIDVDAFQDAITGGHECERQAEWGPAIAAYQAADELYRGDYLEEDPYEDWAIGPREQLHEAYLDTLSRLAECCARQGHYRRALTACQKALALDSLRESVYRQVMVYHYRLGQRDQALRAFERCREVLAEEMGVDPMPETVELHVRILREEIGQKTASRDQQALQVALQREQLDGQHIALVETNQLLFELQREQLAKTDLLLHLQQARGASPTLLSPTDGDKEDEALPPADVPCPYKGLAAYEPEDAEYFFGREKLVAELTAHLAGTRFFGVVGPSGSGKSSLVRVGLLPAIWQGALPGSGAWKTVILAPGTHPLEELAARVSSLSELTPGALLKDLEAEHRTLNIVVKQVLAEEPADVRLLLIVDQFEEVFALCRDEGERRQFIAALLHAVEAADSRTVVVLTIRADFYGQCADYPELATRLKDNVLVGPLNEDELRQVIERPAAQAGLRLDAGLVERIMRDVPDEPGALPLLPHALLETWERRRGRTLTLAGYAETGGVAGAIAQTADTIFQQLSPGRQAITRNIFLRLTELGEEGTQDTRRRVAPAELIPRPEDAPEVEAVLKTLADARLITTGEETVEVAHEALIREWPALRGWLDEDREGLRIHRHLTEAALEWADMDRDPGELYRGARLAAAGEWAEKHAGDLNPLEREFLEVSRDLVQRREAEREARRQRELEAAQNLAEAERRRAEEQIRASGRLRRLAGALAVVLVLAVVAAVLARGEQQQAQAREAEAVAAQATAAAEANIRATEVVVRSTAEAGALDAQATAEAERSRAEREARLATARQLAAQSLASLADDELDLALLLSLESYRTQAIPEARTSLLTGLLYSPHLNIFLHGHTHMVLSVALSPDGKTLASGSRDKTIILWYVGTGQSLGPPLRGHNNQVYSVAFSPDGKTLASGSEDNTIILWNVTTRQPLGDPLRGHSQSVFGVAFSPDGKTLVSGSRDNTIILWDVAGGPSIGRTLTDHAGDVQAVAFSPDGKTLASGTCDMLDPNDDDCTKPGEIHFWDVGTGQPIGPPLTGHALGVEVLSFSPDGSTLASGSDDQTIMLWDVTTRQPLGPPLAGHTDQVWGVAFSPDGKTLASGSSDTYIILWDVATHHPIGEPLAGHSRGVLNVAFSPDGKMLASSSQDYSIILWDVATRQPLRPPLTGHTDWVWPVVFSPDGKTLASGSYDDTVILWDITLESWQARACEMVNRNLTRKEWELYLGDEPYHKTCPDLR